MALVETRDMTVRYAEAPVLRGVNFSIDRGEIVTVVGPNGSGKSTLIRALLGVLKPNSGTVRRQAGLTIGYVPQKLAIDATMPLTVARFLSLPRRRTGAEVSAALRRTGAEGLEGRQISDLSGGQFQRVLLARALLSEPDILILDEPTTGLDQPAEAAFYRLIEQVRNETGAAILLVSHDLHVVMSASDRVVCLNGHVCCEGTPSSVSAAPEYRALFGLGSEGALALYRHRHDHVHDGDDPHDHGAGHEAAPAPGEDGKGSGPSAPGPLPGEDAAHGHHGHHHHGDAHGHHHHGDGHGHKHRKHKDPAG